MAVLISALLVDLGLQVSDLLHQLLLVVQHVGELPLVQELVAPLGVLVQFQLLVGARQFPLVLLDLVLQLLHLPLMALAAVLDLHLVLRLDRLQHLTLSYHHYPGPSKPPSPGSSGSCSSGSAPGRSS